jgi:hypothetical protein
MAGIHRFFLSLNRLEANAALRSSASLSTSSSDYSVLVSDRELIFLAGIRDSWYSFGAYRLGSGVAAILLSEGRELDCGFSPTAFLPVENSVDFATYLATPSL